MNLIVNRTLDKSERQLIYELTLKKRQSKKSTMTERQLAAKQQLAIELMQERGELPKPQKQLEDLDHQQLEEEASDIQLDREGDKQQRKKEANIKFFRTRLEHLNDELERRLYQYEYLVAQEKALLGAYNMLLFANQGVNNFQLHDSHLAAVAASGSQSSARRFARKIGAAHRNSASSSNSFSASSSRSADSSSTAGSLGSAADSTHRHLTQEPPEVRPPTKSMLISSASTVSNLNTLHMLPSLAGPRRSASSAGLTTINQGRPIDP